jgi:hypothetical protein
MGLARHSARAMMMRRMDASLLPEVAPPWAIPFLPSLTRPDLMACDLSCIPGSSATRNFIIFFSCLIHFITDK